MFIETPANPTLRMTDIAAAAAGRAGPRATSRWWPSTTPSWARSSSTRWSTGADLAVYSATKYLAGNSDMLGGVVLGSDPDLIASLRGTRAILGNILQPDECWMLDSRLPTVELRMNRQSKNAQRIAEALAEHPKVAVHALPDAVQRPRADPHPRRRSAASPAPSSRSRWRAARPAPSTSCAACASPATPSAWAASRRSPATPPPPPTPSCAREEQQRHGVTDALVRISVGVEDWRDLLTDFQSALDAL